MKGYEFNLYSPETTNMIGQGFGQGANAIDAFEDAVSQGQVIINAGVEVDVIATSQTGLSIKFGAYKQH